MIRFTGAFATSLFVIACGTDTGTGDDTIDPPGRSAIESCVSSGGAVDQLWATSNQHGAVVSIAVDHATIVLGSEDGSLKQWNFAGASADPTYGARFADDGPVVGGLAVDADGHLFGADQVGMLNEWRFSDAQRMAMLPISEIALSVVAVSAHSEHAAVANGPDTPEIHVVDLATSTVGATLPTALWGVTSLAFGPDALFTAGHCYGTPMVERRSIATPETVASTWSDKMMSGHVNAIALDADATTLIAVGDGFVAVLPADDLAAGPRALTKLAEHAAVGVVLLPGRELFATVGREGTLRVWKADTAELVATLPISAPVGLVADPNGAHLFASGPDGMLRAFDCR